MSRNSLSKVLFFGACIYGFALLIRPYTSCLARPINPGVSEAQEVIMALENAISVLDIPAEQLDFNQLSEVLINHPIYQAELPPDEFRGLLQYTSEIQGEAATKDFGFLTAMRTKRLNQQHGTKLLQAAMERTRAEIKLIPE